jgi:hypothetical protein
MTSPRELASGPPELPGLSAASVWMKSPISRPVEERKERPNALTTPKEDSPLFGLDLFITDRRDLISSANSFTSRSGIPNTLKRSRPPRPAPTVHI